MQLLCVFSLLVALTPASEASAPTASAAPKTQASAPQASAPKASKPAASAPKASAPKGARTIEITGGDDMRFNLTKIEAKRGETLHIVLKSIGTVPKIAMAHNFVALKLTADAPEFIKSGVMARATDFIPPEMKDQVLASTKLAGPGETVDVTFKVPAKAGSYPYLCTFPGHYAAGMKGQLVVK